MQAAAQQQQQEEKEPKQQGHQAPASSAANLEAMDPEILVRTFFPIVRFSSTGAAQRKPGWLQRPGPASHLFCASPSPAPGQAYREHQATAARISLPEEARTLVAYGK